jgi:hypothetical protein
MSNRTKTSSGMSTDDKVAAIKAKYPAVEEKVYESARLGRCLSVSVTIDGATYELACKSPTQAQDSFARSTLVDMHYKDLFQTSDVRVTRRVRTASSNLREALRVLAVQLGVNPGRIEATMTADATRVRLDGHDIDYTDLPALRAVMSNKSIGESES